MFKNFFQKKKPEPFVYKYDFHTELDENFTTQTSVSKVYYSKSEILRREYLVAFNNETKQFVWHTHDQQRKHKTTPAKFSGLTSKEIIKFVENPLGAESTLTFTKVESKAELETLFKQIQSSLQTKLATDISGIDSLVLDIQSFNVLGKPNTVFGYPVKELLNSNKQTIIWKTKYEQQLHGIVVEQLKKLTIN